MNQQCHRCDASDSIGTFRRERMPFRGTRIYCPKCHTKYENNFIAGIYLLLIGFGVASLVFLRLDPSSHVGHVWLNIVLLQVLFLLSTIAHEFAHAVAGKLAGLTVSGIWIGRGRTVYRIKICGFDTEFKMIPAGGLTIFRNVPKSGLRWRYFAAFSAGPFINVLILIVSGGFISWRSFNLETSIQLAAITFIAQAIILLELLPFRIQTPMGTMSSDGLCLVRLVTSGHLNPPNSHLSFSFGTKPERFSWTLKKTRGR